MHIHTLLAVHLTDNKTAAHTEGIPCHAARISAPVAYLLLRRCDGTAAVLTGQREHSILDSSGRLHPLKEDSLLYLSLNKVIKRVHLRAAGKAGE